MATATYTPIASQTLTSSASSVTFSSIPTDGTYRDLVLVIRASATTGGYGPWFRFNSAAANYNWVMMRGNGSTAVSSASASQSELYNDINNININTTDDHVTILHVFDYAQTNKHKSVLMRSNSAGLATLATAGRWADTSAITSILVDLDSANYAAGSTFSLYGISA